MGDFRDPAVAESWHASQLDHPARGEPLDLLANLAELLQPHEILDMGVGSGLVAERLLDRLPETSFVGVDFSPAMLAKASDRLSRFGPRVTLVEGDLASPEQIHLPALSFELVVSVQTLHNMSPSGQRAALRWLGETLSPGGIALLLDKLAVPEALYPLYPALTALPATWDEYVEAERAADESAPSLEAQLDRLREAQLLPAVLHLHGHYALIAARRPT